MKQNGLGLFHLILRNRNIKKQEHLWCAVTALNKVIGRQSFRIAAALNSEEDNLYHLGLFFYLIRDLWNYRPVH